MKVRNWPCFRASDIPAYARRAKSAGFDELWLAEDCFFAGGIAAVSAALAELYARRLIIGLGHGMAGWIRQIGAYPRSPLTALAEHLHAIRALLAGEPVSADGDYVRLDRVRLDHPPAHVPPVLAGVRGPRSLDQ
jgi:5,10-methylenetetrahydromethanopterin reductase